MRYSILAVAALVGLLLGLPRSATAQGAHTSATTPVADSGKKTLEDRLGEIEQQLKDLKKRLDSVESNSAAKPAVSPTQDNDEGSQGKAAWAAQIDALDQKIRIAEQKRELEAETAAARAKAAPLVSAGSDGFTIKSADSAFSFTLRGNLQADMRFFPNGAPAPGASTFTTTKVRPTFEGVLFKHFSFKIMPDFGSGGTSIQDAYIDVNIRPWLKIRGGKFKGPVGLERLVADAELEFYERFLPSNLVPNREVGFQLSGEPWGGVVTYAGGIFNGVADGASTDLDTDNHREFEGRLFFHPFRRTSLTRVQGFGIGLSGTSGHQTGSTSAPVVAAYKTTAQVNFFRYRSDGTVAGSVLADGRHWRISPQANYYWGQVGAWGEYVLSSQDVRRGTANTTVDNAAWQVAVTYVLTGEKASYRAVTPAHPFDLKRGTWGAFELGARYGQLSVDKSAFPIFADPRSSASGARSWTIGMNWYANRNVRIVLDYEQTDFQTVEGGVKRKQERALLQRFQLAF